MLRNQTHFPKVTTRPFRRSFSCRLLVVRKRRAQRVLAHRLREMLRVLLLRVGAERRGVSAAGRNAAAPACPRAQRVLRSNTQCAKWSSEGRLCRKMNAALFLLIAALCGAEELLEQRVRSGRRTCRLYCRVGIGFHLQIHPDGRVNGSHEPNHLSKYTEPFEAQIRPARAGAASFQLF
ncbi:hypothetical protein OJAV_G00095280 [Oryzias javanicus]|uniref:Uncharacterized protein n=1 Tax=Oryzias javanicus TaxID=123683 RepID=A0A3S2MX00_ORYJA|nr:hypothetical protein OJAV_G00095280 [Oryzias javanicus]